MPEMLSESDTLRFNLASARIVAAEAALGLAREQFESLRLRTVINYGMGPKDSFNADSGLIVRAPKEPPAEKPEDPPASVAA
jgi:hypothetical protein